MKKVLITGAEGTIGTALREHYGDRYEFSGITLTPQDFPSTVADISDLVDLLAGGSLVYTIDGSVVDLAPGPSVSASATVAVPPGVTDPVASNDSDVADVVIPSIFSDGFESGDTAAWSAAVP